MSANKMSDIFISHASLDHKLADAFARLLEGGINLSQKQIFCTSLEEQGIPAGKDFKAFIQTKLEHSEIVIALITQNYYGSAFCMCELGATWIRAKDFLPFVVAPLTFNDLHAVLSGMQALRIDDPVSLDQARDRIAPLAKEPAGTARWTKRRDEFLAAIPGILKSLPKPQVIKPEDFKKLQSEKADYKREYEKSDEENQSLRKKVEELKKLKDRTEVARIERKHSGEWNTFASLAKDAASQLDRHSPVVKEAFFQRFRGSEFRPNAESWSDDPVEAVEDGLLEVDEERGVFSVNEENPKIRKTLAALRELRSFVDEADEQFQKQYEHKYDEALDMQIRPFWERHLGR